MREIVVDTETTGLSCLDGHRIVEVACVELQGGALTGRHWHSYFNPERPMPSEAIAIHGLTETFLASAPLFRERAADFLKFVGKAPIVAHNASFDLAFLNAELARSSFPAISGAVDTLELAKRKLPGRHHTLDRLCDHFKISRSNRSKHGALVDAELLAQVYGALTGNNRTQLALDFAAAPSNGGSQNEHRRAAPLSSRLSAAEIAAHEAFVRALDGPAIWNTYSTDEISTARRSRK